MNNCTDTPVSRRSFLKITTCAGVGYWLAGCVSEPSITSPPGPYGGFAMGVQSYCFRKFELDEALDKTRQLGLDFIEVFPGHLPTNTPPERMEQVKDKLTTLGIAMNAYGVVGCGKDHKKNECFFAFAKSTRIGSLTASPAPDSFDSLERLVQKYQINIAIHNHGPGDKHYATDEQILKAIEGRHQRIGSCVDTGHFLRAKVNPVEPIRKLASRVYAIHLKDADAKGKDVIVGEGVLDLVGMFRALRDIGFSGPISLEYESEPDNPLPAISQCLVAVRDALKQLAT